MIKYKIILISNKISLKSKMTELDEIKKWCDRNNSIYVPIDDPVSISKIYNLLFANKTENSAEKPKVFLCCGASGPAETGVEFLYFGRYYYYIQKNDERMIECFKKAIDLGYAPAMTSLAFYYRKNGDFDLMMKYYNMAIDLGYAPAMTRLGDWYCSVMNDNDQMLKYYMMAINLGHSNAMYDLGWYYYKQKEYNQMLKYYMMAINLGHSDAMNNLGWHYYEQKDYDQMLKYYMMAINLGDSGAMNNLGWHYYEQKDYDQMIKYFEMACDLSNKKAFNNLEKYYTENNLYDRILELYFKYKKWKEMVLYINTFNKKDSNTKSLILQYLADIPKDLVYEYSTFSIQMLYNLLHEKLDFYKLHFEYTINGKGYEEAKTDFITRVTV